MGRAKSRNVFGRTKSQPTHYESQWSQHAFFGSRKFAINLFGCAKSQHTHFELQYSQHTFCGSRKVASYLFWFAQSRANFSFAQSHNIPILSRNGRNIPFFGREKSQHTHFELQYSQHTFCGSRKVATHLFGVAQSRIISVLVRAKSRKFFGRAKSQHTDFELQWPQHTFFWFAQSRIISVLGRAKSLKVATLYFESQCSHYNFVGSCEGASYLFWVAQNAS